jgi:hypothetical protein
MRLLSSYPGLWIPEYRKDYLTLFMKRIPGSYGESSEVCQKRWRLFSIAGSTASISDWVFRQGDKTGFMHHSRLLIPSGRHMEGFG